MVARIFGDFHDIGTIHSYIHKEIAMKAYKKAITSATLALFSLIGTASAQFWNLSGNVVSVPDFIGSTNNAVFRMFTNNTERARIDASGNVGIGTGSPVRRLHLATTNTPQLRMSNASGGWDIQGGYDFAISISSTEWLRFDSAAHYVSVGPNDELFISSSTGNVGLGTTNAHDKLTVNGSITPFADCFYTFGRSGRRWNTIYARQGTIYTSDARLKENIQDLGYGLDEVMKLRPVSFTWKDDPGYGPKLGLLAQEVQPVINEVVKTGEEGNMGLCYDELLPVLVRAVQQQQGMLTAEATENMKLQNGLAAQEERIRELETALGIPH